MAKAIAASYDRRDVVAVVEVDSDLGRDYYGSSRVLSSAVRNGLMTRTNIPKRVGSRVFRTTYAATDRGGIWLEGYRRWLEEQGGEEVLRRLVVMDCGDGLDCPVPVHRARARRTTMAEVAARRGSEAREKVRKARSEMMERIRMRRRDLKSWEKGLFRRASAGTNGSEGSVDGRVNTTEQEKR